MVDVANVFPRDQNGGTASPLAYFDGVAWRYASIDSDGLFGTRSYVWDTGTLAWVKGTQASGGGGGGSVTVSNFPATQAVSGTFWQATQPVSAVSLPLPSNAAQETGGGLATLVARLPVQGQALMAASVPVAFASNQSALAVTGAFYQATQPVSGAFYQATQPVSGTFWQTTQPISVVSLPLPTNAATETGGNLATTATNTGRIPAQGQAAMVASTPVVIASNQSAVPVSGTFWQTTQPVSGTVTANAGTGTMAISAASLPLPTSAATETTLGTRLAEATFTTRVPVQGQAASAQGTNEVLTQLFSGNPLKSTTANTATTIVCPATTGTIWRVNVTYYTGT